MIYNHKLLKLPQSVLQSTFLYFNTIVSYPGVQANSLYKNHNELVQIR
jgi:hypothetical protein